MFEKFADIFGSLTFFVDIYWASCQLFGLTSLYLKVLKASEVQ